MGLDVGGGDRAAATPEPAPAARRRQPERAVPPAVVHRAPPDVRAACKTLGLPYADALVGFEHKAGGLTVPKVGGVVVLEKHVPVLVSATEDLDHRKVQKNEAKKTKRVLGHWHRLVSLVLLRKKVSNKFATPGK